MTDLGQLTTDERLEHVKFMNRLANEILYLEQRVIAAPKDNKIIVRRRLKATLKAYDAVNKLDDLHEDDQDEVLAT